MKARSKQLKINFPKEEHKEGDVNETKTSRKRVFEEGEELQIKAARAKFRPDQKQAEETKNEDIFDFDEKDMADCIARSCLDF